MQRKYRKQVSGGTAVLNSYPHVAVDLFHFIQFSCMLLKKMEIKVDKCKNLVCN